jgi:hypothetical protein
MSLHLTLEVASAVLCLLPLVAIALAYRRGRSARLAWAFVAFALLLARFVAIVVVHTVLPVDHVTEELVDFGGSLAAMSAFAVAFLYGGRWSVGGSPAGIA